MTYAIRTFILMVLVHQYEKMINFDVYKPVKNDVQFEYLFLGTNNVYYKRVQIDG